MMTGGRLVGILEQGSAATFIPHIAAERSPDTTLQETQFHEIKEQGNIARRLKRFMLSERSQRCSITDSPGIP
jgi:hypothetical protein